MTATRGDRRSCARSGHEAKVLESGSVVCWGCGIPLPRSSLLVDDGPKVAGLEVTVAPMVMGRVTGWLVVCSEHGAADKARPSEFAATSFAGEHLEEFHEGKGRIRVVRKERPVGRRRARGRRRGA